MNFKRILLAFLIAANLVSFASAWEPAFYLPDCHGSFCPDYYTIGHGPVSEGRDVSAPLIFNGWKDLNQPYLLSNFLYIRNQIGGSGQPSSYQANCDNMGCW